MRGVPSGRNTPFEEHSATLFLVAGTLLIGYAGLNGLKAFTAVQVEPNLFEVGYVFGFLGLVGLYLRGADRHPWLARAGALAAVCGAVAIAGFNLRRLAVIAGLVSDGPPWNVFVLMALVGFVVGYLAVAAAHLRSGAPSRTVGVVLSIPGLIVVFMLVHIAAGWDSLGTAFVISAGQAMAHLAIGATLRAEAEPSDREDVESAVASDATARG